MSGTVRESVDPTTTVPAPGRVGTGTAKPVAVALAVVAALVLLASGGLGPLAPPVARADAGPGSDLKFYRSVIDSVSPAVPGLTVEVTPTGEWVRVTNTTATRVVVLGYTDEPYVRVGPGGTEENTSSLATYLNNSLTIAEVPRNWKTERAHWRRVDGSHSYAWHDHRVHWMSSNRPPAVARDPGHPHLVSNWTLHLLYGTVPVTVTGTLRWTGRAGLFTSTASRVVWLVGLVALLVIGWRLIVMRRQPVPASGAVRDVGPGPVPEVVPGAAADVVAGTAADLVPGAGPGAVPGADPGPRSRVRR